MGVTQSLTFLLSFQLLQVIKGSTVWLNENGYEDLVVAINPQVPEDANIILNTMNMIKNASNYLFEMTKHRFFFKSVKIIIPKTWKKNTNYSRVKTESYDQADVIIADYYMKHVDDPYTLLYEGCKMKGRYIHFTPNFLLNENLTNVYGEKGRVFVHEWTHFRWGVFDEYSRDVPFYVSEKATIEATSCPAGVTGIPVFQDCRGDICKPRSCRYDGQLYEKGCVFIPDVRQNISCSIMYMQYARPVANLNWPPCCSATISMLAGLNLVGLHEAVTPKISVLIDKTLAFYMSQHTGAYVESEVVEFCDQNTHNSEAPNMQNKICNHKSTWEVIMESDDFRNSTVLNTSAPSSETTFRLLQAQERVICLVLDISGSMRMHNRMENLLTAAETYLLHVIETGSWVAIVTFDSDATERAHLQQITDDETRQKLVQFLPTIPSGLTNICAGIHKGLKVIANKMNTTYGSEIVLLTDGEDPGIAACFNLVKQSGAKIHTIALGPQADKKLEELSELTGGLKLCALDGVVPSKLTEVFSAITSGNGDISEQSIQLESKELVVQHSAWMNTTVPVDKTVGNDTFFSIAWNLSQPFFFLRDPKGKEYGSSDFTIDNSNTYTARLHISGTAEVGDWQFYIKNVHTATQGISVTATSRPTRYDVAPVIAAAHMNRANTAFNPVVVYAEVSQGFWPVLGATVTATIEKDGATAVTLELLDNGAGADMMKNDGIYSRYFTSLQGTGRYSLKVKSHGRNATTSLSLKRNQALYNSGYRENGKIYLTAPKPEFADEEIQVQLGSFSRISTGSFVVSTGDPAPIYPPCKITDLHARIENRTIVLSWTAPGGDFDNGKADHYIIKTSENLLHLRNDFDRATSVNCSNLIPKEAGREESFEIQPEDKTENGTKIYFAICAVDDTNLISEVSNIAQTTWFLPPEAFVPLNHQGSTNSVNTPVIVAVAALCVAVVCTIINSTLYVFSKKKGRLEIEKMQRHV